MRSSEDSDQALDASILAALNLLDFDEADTPPSSEARDPPDPLEPVRVKVAVVGTVGTRSLRGNRSNRFAVDQELRAGAFEVAKRHCLPADLAVAVAARRMTLKAALAARNVRTRNAQLPDQSLSSWSIALAVLVALVAGLSLYVRSSWLSHVASVRESAPRHERAAGPPRGEVSEPTGPMSEATPTAHTEVSRAAGGTVVRVEGPNPGAVLDSYCEASLACSPGWKTEITAAALNTPGVRIGIYRDADDPARERAVYIHRDPRSHRWAVGNGQRIKIVDPPRTSR